MAIIRDRGDTKCQEMKSVEIHIGYMLKQRTDAGLRLTIKSERFGSSGKALMTYEQWVLDNEGKQGMIVELQILREWWSLRNSTREAYVVL